MKPSPILPQKDPAQTKLIVPAEISALQTMPLAELEVVIEKNLAAFVVVGQALKLICERKAYAPIYRSFRDYCRARFKVSRQYGYRLIKSSEIALELSPNGEIALNEGQVRPLCRLASPDARRDAFALATQSTASGPPTSTHVRNAVQDILLNERVTKAKAKSQSEPPANDKLWSQIIRGDAAEADLLPPNSVHVVVGSPGYNVGKNTAAHDDSLPYEEYLAKLQLHLTNCYTWAVEAGGRMALNVAIDTRKHGPQPLSADLTKIAQAVGWRYESCVVWDEGSHQSWASDIDPVQNVRITCRCEVILIFCKGALRPTPPQTPDITRSDLAQWSHGYWSIPGAHRTDGHPCPYPPEIPRRLIKLLSYPGDVILDPWAGLGTTVVEAVRLGRTGIGIDIEQKFCELAQAHLAEVTSGLPGKKSAKPKRVKKKSQVT